jgi:hypothetical protein
MAASATFERLTDSPFPGLALRVTIRGVTLPPRAAPIAGAVGDVPLVALSFTFDESLQGFLAEEPPAGAVLRLGYRGSELFDTSVTYDPTQV